MSKKILILTLTLCLTAAIVGPAAAKKKGKKNKAPKPYVSEEVSVGAAHPVFNGQSGTVVGVTAQEFINSCGIPSSNGVDAYVFEVPKAYEGRTASLVAKGTSAGAAGYDLDLYLFDSECQQTYAFNAEGTDEYGQIYPGVAYILVHNYLGDPNTAAQIELTAL